MESLRNAFSFRRAKTLMNSYPSDTGPDSPMPPNILERDFLSSIGMSITNVSDQIVLCATAITSSVTVHATINSLEY